MFRHWSLHRAELVHLLYDTAVRLGASVEFHKRVESIDLSEPAFVFSDGTRATGDLLIGADGMESPNASNFRL